MENVKFIVLLLLIVVCDSNCPSTWYAIPENRCIKVINDNAILSEIHVSKLCEKYTIGTKVASYFSVTSPYDLAILNNFCPWILRFYLDWNYDGSNYYYSDGPLIDIEEYSLTDDTGTASDCVAVNIFRNLLFADCSYIKVGYVCEIKL